MKRLCSFFAWSYRPARDGYTQFARIVSLGVLYAARQTRIILLALAKPIDKMLASHYGAHTQRHEDHPLDGRAVSLVKFHKTEDRDRTRDKGEGLFSREAFFGFVHGEAV